MDLATFLKSHEITATAQGADSNPNMPDTDMTQHFLVTLHKGGTERTMQVPFSGAEKAFLASNGKPTVADVIEVLTSDASSAGQSFENWAADFGYDTETDSRREYAQMRSTWEAIETQTQEFREFLGEVAFEELGEIEF